MTKEASNRQCIRATQFPHFYLIFLSILFIWSCDRDVIYEKNHSFDGTWPRGVIPGFTVDITDTIHPADFLLSIRHNTDYPYSNLYLFVETYYPNGTDIRDTIEILLAKPNGEWLGKGFGKLKTSRVLLNSGIRFPMKGEYKFTFEQAMRVDSLEGMEDLGITIEKMQDNH